MDHHQNSWRPPPPLPPPPVTITMQQQQQQGNNNSTCPICSISHFPFCPPHPPFYQNPNQPFLHNHNNNYFINHNNHFPQTPHYDPPPPPPLPYHHHHHRHPHPPIDNGFGDRNPWHRNPSFSSAHNDDENFARFKRMRPDDSASFTNGNLSNTYTNFVSEDAKRLKSLIRDHGGVSVNDNGYMRENTVLQREIDAGERGKIDGFHLKPSSNVEMYEFQNPNIDYFENGGTSHSKPGFSPLKYSEEVGRQYMCNNGDEEFRRPQYGQSENYKIHSSGRDGNISHTIGRFSDIKQARQIQDEEGPYHERGVQSNSHVHDDYLSVHRMGEKNLPSVVSPSVHYSLSRGHHEDYGNQSSQRNHQSDSLSVNEPHYSHPTNWRGMEQSMNEKRHNLSMTHQQIDNHKPHSYAAQHPMQPDHDTRQSFRANILTEDEFSSPYGQQNLNKGSYPPMFSCANVAPTQASSVFDVYPPLPASPPPPLPVEPPVHPYNNPFASSSPPKTSSFLFPISVSSSTNVPSAYPSVVEAHSSAQAYYADKPHHNIPLESFEARQPLSKKYSREVHAFPLRQVNPDKPKPIDASQIFKLPHRATRPDHIVIILRGLPGSGKSYMAKILRELEVENGGDAPRIHSMDDYFMTEVEKVDDSDFSKSSGSVRGKKAVTKKVMEYCYEPEMEEAYRSSMLKAFKKTLDEGVFSFVIVDDRNLRVADFAQFWAIAKRTGFEVYLLESSYKDPAGCAARNVHGFTQDEIQKMAGQWEEAPSLYLKLDIKSLLHRDDLEESGIQEVDMDMEDEDPSGGLSGSEETHSQTLVAPIVEYSESSGSSKDGIRRDAGGHPTEEVKELRKSKWSDDFGEDDAERTENSIRNSTLSGLINTYSKEGKSVCWGDTVANMGFSIGAGRKPNVLSLVIGPGAGYNLKSNPLVEQDDQLRAGKSVEPKRQNKFQQQLRAERESFKAVFEKRKQRIGGFGTVEE